MPDFIPLHDIYQNMTDIFTGILFAAILAMYILKFLMPKRYALNIKAPNIYVFEYEAQSGRLLSFYNLLSLIIKLLSYALFILALLFFCQKIYNTNCFSISFYKKIILAFLIYILAKIILEEVYLRSIKKSSFVAKMRFIRLSFENYLAFYLFIIAFLSFFFPVKNTVIFIIIISISMLWSIFVLFNFYNSLTKHFDIKKYQIILYLCLSEILPFISLIGWIIFQIL